jgi:hypothetical protein
MRGLRVLPLLLAVGIAAAGCGGGSTSAGDIPTTPGTVSSGGPVDVCQYLTQSDAQSILGMPTGPGKLEHVAATDSTCAYKPKTATVVGTSVALTLSTSDFVGSTISDFKSGYPGATAVDGLGHPAIRSADGAAVAVQGDKRACTVIVGVKKPADPDSFAKQLGGICRKAVEG